jgi:hypothetical protein
MLDNGPCREMVVLVAALKATRAENASLASQLSTYQAKDRDCWRAVGW